jgi:hypothetical protein
MTSTTYPARGAAIHLVGKWTDQAGTHGRDVHLDNENGGNCRNTDKERREIESAQSPLGVQCDDAFNRMHDNVAGEELPVVVIGVVKLSSHNKGLVRR